jgi:two-component system, OmpR family, response regulator
VSDEHHPTGEVLVIDDDPIMRDLMTDWLEAAGYPVRRATDCGSAGIELERAPALVVSDMWMPGPCGAEAIRWMRQKHPGLRLIAVSGHFGSGQGCTEEAAVGAGAARALPKPVKRAELLAAVAELIGPPRR